MDYCVVGASYIVEGDRTEVVLSLRDPEGRRIIKTDRYQPYFYIQEKQYGFFRRLLELEPELEEYILDIKRGYRSWDGKDLLKIVVKAPFQVKKFVEASRNHKEELKAYIVFYEANILFKYRYLIDHGIYTGVDENLRPVETESRHRMAILDIEVYGETFEEENYRNPIILIGLYDYYTDRYFIIGPPPGVTVNLPDNASIIHCKDEDELIANFKKVWTELSPDIVITFSKYDMRYIYKRLLEKKKDPKFLSPIGIVSRNMNINCLDILDYSEVYKKVFGEPGWNTLDYISKKELGYGKVVLPGSITEVWPVDPSLVVLYNFRDVQLIKDLEDKLGLIRNFIVPIWKITGLEFSKCIKANAIADILHLRDSYGKFVWRSHASVQVRPYKGAIVEAEPGLYENVAVLDWEELYPSIMETFHISWDTWTPNGGDIKIDNKLEFSSKDPGQTVLIMRPLRERRREIKERLKEAPEEEKKILKMLSSAYKAIINALYGIYGFAPKSGLASRLYVPEVASAVTLMGRRVFEETKKFVESIGYKMVYGDTDSIFILLKGEDYKTEASEVARRIEEHISNYIRQNYGVHSKLHISPRDILRKLLVLTKKRYLGVTFQGEMIIKGLEYVRRETAPITSTVQKRLGEILLSGNKEEAEKYVEEVCRMIKEGRIPLEDLAIRPRCTKEDYKTLTRNLKAILFAEKFFGEKIRPGERFFLLYLKGNKSTHINFKGREIELLVNVIGLKKIRDLPKDLEVDYEKMAEYTVLEPSRRFLEAINKKPFKYKTLDSYFGG